MSDETGVVIEFDTLNRPRSPIRKARRGCSHLAYELNEAAMIVRCRDCGDTVDPLAVVRWLANQWGAIEASVDSLRKERTRLFDDVEDLKRQRRNLKAQVARAQRSPKKASGPDDQ